MFDPFYWYERELDNDYLARQNGYEDYEDYLEHEGKENGKEKPWNGDKRWTFALFMGTRRSSRWEDAKKGKKWD